MSINDVKVTIGQQVVVGNIGFGTPLILKTCQATAVPYTECEDITAVKTLFPDSTSGSVTTVDPVAEAAMLIFSGNNPPKKIAVCAVTGTAATAIPTLLQYDWRQLVVVTLDETGEKDQVDDISALVKTLPGRMFFTHVNAGGATTSIASTMAAAVKAIGDSDRTVVVAYNGSYSSDTEGSEVEATCKFPEAALLGSTAGLNPGSFTYKNMIISGVEEEVYTDTELNNPTTGINTANGIAIVKKAGDIVTSEGKVLSGDFIDDIDSKDWIISNIEYGIQSLLNKVNKLPYDNTGISQLEAVVTNVLQQAFSMGIIAANDDSTPAYKVDFATREETKKSDIAARKYLGGSFTFKLAGAVHTVEITGYIEV